MELDQKFNFLTKCYKYVADPPDQDFPNFVLLFEPRMSHPALRVTTYVRTDARMQACTQTRMHAYMHAGIHA